MPHECHVCLRLKWYKDQTDKPLTGGGRGTARHPLHLLQTVAAKDGKPRGMARYLEVGHAVGDTVARDAATWSDPINRLTAVEVRYHAYCLARLYRLYDGSILSSRPEAATSMSPEAPGATNGGDDPLAAAAAKGLAIMGGGGAVWVATLHDVYVDAGGTEHEGKMRRFAELLQKRFDPVKHQLGEAGGKLLLYNSAAVMTMLAAAADDAVAGSPSGAPLVVLDTADYMTKSAAHRVHMLARRRWVDGNCNATFPPDSTRITQGAVDEYLGPELQMFCRTLICGIGSLYADPDAPLTAHDRQKQRAADFIGQMLVNAANCDRCIRKHTTPPPGLLAIAMAARARDTKLPQMLTNFGLAASDEYARHIDYTWMAVTNEQGVRFATQTIAGRVVAGRDNIDMQKTLGLESSPGFHDAMTAFYGQRDPNCDGIKMPGHVRVRTCPEPPPPPSVLYLKKPKPWPPIQPSNDVHPSFRDGRAKESMANQKRWLFAHALSAADNGEEYENFTVAYKACEGNAGRINPALHSTCITAPIGGPATNDTFNYRYLQNLMGWLDDLGQDDCILALDGGDYEHMCKLIWEDPVFAKRLFLEPGGLHLGMLITKLLGRVAGLDGYKEWWLLADVVGQEEVDKVFEGKLYTKARRLWALTYAALMRILVARFVEQHPNVAAADRDAVAAALSNPGGLKLPAKMEAGPRTSLENLQRDLAVWCQQQSGASAQFAQLMKVIEIAELLMLLTLVYQSEDTEECGEGSVQVLYEICGNLSPWCHGYNNHKYARILGVFMVQLEQCHKTHPGVWEDYHKNGDVSMKLKNTRVPRDRIMEEAVIKQAKEAAADFKEVNSKSATAWAGSIAAKIAFLSAAHKLAGLPDPSPQTQYTRKGEAGQLEALVDSWYKLDDPIALPTGEDGSTIKAGSRWNLVTGTLAAGAAGGEIAGMYDIGKVQSDAFLTELRETVGKPGLNTDKGYFKKFTRNPMPLPLPAVKGVVGAKSSVQLTINVMHEVVVRWELLPGTKLSLDRLLAYPLTPFPMMTADPCGRMLLESGKSALTRSLRSGDGVTPFADVQARVFARRGQLPGLINKRSQRSRTAVVFDGGQVFVRQTAKEQSCFGTYIHDVKEYLIAAGLGMNAATIYLAGELYPPVDTKIGTGEKRASNKTVPVFAQLTMTTKIGSKVKVADTLRSRGNKIKLNRLLEEEFLNDTSGSLKAFLQFEGSSLVTLILDKAHRYTLGEDLGIFREELPSLASNLPEADHRFLLVATHHHDLVMRSDKVDWMQVDRRGDETPGFVSHTEETFTFNRPVPTQTLVVITEDADNTAALVSLSHALPNLAVGIRYGKGNDVETVDLHSMADSLPTGLARMIRGLHVLSGEDSNSKFKGFGKCTWLKNLKAAHADPSDGSPDALVLLGLTDYTEADICGDGELAIEFEAMAMGLRELMLRVLGAHDVDSVLTLNDARYWQFTTKGKADLGDLAITDSQWRYHVLRTNHLCRVWMCGTVVPALPVPSCIGRGWRMGADGNPRPVWHDEEELPEVLRATYSCKSCKTGCLKSNCTCHKAGRKCTALCGCTNCNNRGGGQAPAQ